MLKCTKDPIRKERNHFKLTLPTFLHFLGILFDKNKISHFAGFVLIDMFTSIVYVLWNVPERFSCFFFLSFSIIFLRHWRCLQCTSVWLIKIINCDFGSLSHRLSINTEKKSKINSFRWITSSVKHHNNRVRSKKKKTKTKLYRNKISSETLEMRCIYWARVQQLNIRTEIKAIPSLLEIFIATRSHTLHVYVYIYICGMYADTFSILTCDYHKYERRPRTIQCVHYSSFHIQWRHQIKK